MSRTAIDIYSRTAGRSWAALYEQIAVLMRSKRVAYYVTKAPKAARELVQRLCADQKVEIEVDAEANTVRLPNGSELRCVRRLPGTRPRIVSTHTPLFPTGLVRDRASWRRILELEENVER